MEPKLVDYHVHTGEPFLDQNPPHAKGSWEDYFETGKKFGIIPGNSNHPPHYFGKKNANLHSYENNGFLRGSSFWEFFLEKNLDFRNKNPQAPLGLEVDFFPEIKQNQYIDAISTGYLNFKKNPSKKIIKTLNTHPFDYLIISTHFLFGKPFDTSIKEYVSLKKSAGDNQKKVIKKYWETILESTFLCKAIKKKTPIKTLIIGHIDLIKTISLFEKNLPVNSSSFYEDNEEVIDKILKNIKAFDLKIEFNTSGARKNLGVYPSPFIMKKALNLNIPLVFGSDSHRPYKADFKKYLLLFKNFAVS